MYLTLHAVQGTEDVSNSLSRAIQAALKEHDIIVTSEQADFAALSVISLVMAVQVAEEDSSL